MRRTLTPRRRRAAALAGLTASCAGLLPVLSQQSGSRVATVAGIVTGLSVGLVILAIRKAKPGAAC